MATLERGFKAWSERTATAVRRELGIGPVDPLPVGRLAEHLGVVLMTPHDVVGMPADDLQQLTATDPWGWSAVTVENDNGPVVIYNSNHSSGRQASDIAHELAHIMLGHQPGTIVLSADGSMAMRSFNQKQEDEANWLAWSLLLPRDAIVRVSAKGMDAAAIALAFGVTETLARFRLQMTGVGRQLKWRPASRRRAV